MSSETERVVKAFLEDVVRVGAMHGGARNHAAEDVTWWLPGSARDGALRGREQVVDWFESRGDADALFHEPPVVTVEQVLVDGDRAVAQFRAVGRAKSGKTYDNRYALWMRVADGKIAELREFYDTQHVNDTFRAGASGRS